MELLIKKISHVPNVSFTVKRTDDVATQMDCVSRLSRVTISVHSDGDYEVTVGRNSSEVAPLLYVKLHDVDTVAVMVNVFLKVMQHESDLTKLTSEDIKAAYAAMSSNTCEPRAVCDPVQI